ncbi:MAG: nucleobase:cation symporter-2 family protein [Actinomycetota bacterium]
MSTHPDVAETADRAGRRPEDARLPIMATLGYGMQHVLSMFGGVIAVPIIIGGAAGLKGADIAFLISCALFVSGLATVLQTLGVPYLGAQLPLVQGISFASVSTLIAIVAGHGQEGLRTAYGAIIVAGILAFLIVPFFASIVRFFPPVVTGSIITVIGLSLLPVAGGWIAGQPGFFVDGKSVPNPAFGDPGSIGLAMFTLLVVLILMKFKMFARMAILLSLVIGTLAALVTGQAKFNLVNQSIVAFPQPFKFGLPIFAIGAIVSMLIVMLVIMVETTADILAVGEVVGTEVPAKRVANGLRADMLSSFLAPVFNSFSATAFAQNVGLVALTRIKSRFVVAAGGGMLILFGLSPLLAAVVNVIPLPVLGGAGIALFGSVAASGVRTLSKVNYDASNNLIIVAVSLGMGLVPSVVSNFWHQFPSWFSVVANSGISACALMAVLLNIWFNMVGTGKHEGSALASHGPARGIDADVLGSLPK